METELSLATPPSSKAAESSPRTANRLTLSQTFALGTWIKDHEQQAKDDPDTQAAQHAALALGFPVTAANFTAARQALKIEKTKPTTPPTVEERLLALETELQRLNQQSVHDVNHVNEVRSHLNTKIESVDRNLATQFTKLLTDLDARHENEIARINQTLTNHHLGFEDLLKRLQTLERRFQPESDPTPLPPPGRMATEVPHAQ